MLASAGVLLLMHMIVILMLAMSTKFRTLMTLLIYSIFVVVRRIEPFRCLFECILVDPASSARL